MATATTTVCYHFLQVGSKKAKIDNSQSLLISSYDCGAVIVMPDEYLPVAGNYINLLHGKASSITTANKLVDCFVMNNYLQDHDYFNYLVQQLHDRWSSLASAVTTNSNLTDTTLRQIYLYTPFNLAPDNLKLDSSFVRLWLETNGSGSVATVDSIHYTLTVNSDYNFFISMSSSSCAVAVDQQPFAVIVDQQQQQQQLQMTSPVIKEVDYLLYDSYVLRQEGVVVNGQPDGEFRSWYEEGGLAQQTDYVKGIRHGCHKLWHRNGRLKKLEHYYNDELCGHSVSYHGDGVTVLAVGDYHHDRRTGFWRLCDYDKKLYSEGYYNSGVKVGNWLIKNNYGMIVQQPNYDVVEECRAAEAE